MSSFQLQNLLQKILPTAILTKTAVPLLCHPKLHQPCSLWLIDENFCHQDLTYDVIERLWKDCPYWVFAWASGQILAQYVMQHPSLVQDKIVMDFGAGSGIVGIAAKLAGAKQVICCDIDRLSLFACQQNALLNQVKIDTLDNVFELSKQFNLSKVDVLLVADVLYDKANLPLLDVFLQVAEHVLVADSRVKHFQHPHYQKVISLDDTTTLPDMDEAKQFNQVVIYQNV